jgi:hypothetical protein
MLSEGTTENRPVLVIDNAQKLWKNDEVGSGIIGELRSIFEDDGCDVVLSDIITDDSDDFDDDGYLPKVSDNRVRFSPLNQSLVVVVVCHWPCRESYGY